MEVDQSKYKSYAITLLSLHDEEVHNLNKQNVNLISVSRVKFDSADYYSKNYSGLYEFVARNVPKSEYSHEGRTYYTFSKSKLEDIACTTMQDILAASKKYVNPEKGEKGKQK